MAITGDKFGFLKEWFAQPNVRELGKHFLLVLLLLG